MSDFLTDGPFALVFVALFLGAMARGQLMYWAGRIVTEQTLQRTAPTEGWQLKVHSWLQGGGADAGIRAIRRWGLAIVPVGYLTVGFQSMVQVGAGVLRIKLLWYALAQIPGALAWALIYSTIGFAIWSALIAAAAGSPLGLAAILAVAIVLVATIALRRRHRQRARVGALTPVPTADDPDDAHRAGTHSVDGSNVDHHHAPGALARRATQSRSGEGVSTAAP